jgi:hypothetical protein
MKLNCSRLLGAAVLSCVCLVSSAFADTLPVPKTVLLTWLTPLENVDGSLDTDLFGFYIYCGSSPDTLQPYYFTTAVQPYLLISYLDDGPRYFAVTAVNADGVESSPTAVVSDQL